MFYKIYISKDYKMNRFDESVLDNVIKEYRNKWVNWFESRASKDFIIIIESIKKCEDPEYRKKLFSHAIYVYMNNPNNHDNHLYKLLSLKFDEIFPDNI